MGKRGFASAAIGFLLTVRDGHPTTPIVVTSPIFGTWRETLGPSKAIFAPDEGQTAENQNQMLMSLQETRSQLKGVVEMLRGRGDSNLHYRDGLELLGEVSKEESAHCAPVGLPWLITSRVRRRTRRGFRRTPCTRAPTATRRWASATSTWSSAAPAG